MTRSGTQGSNFARENQVEVLTSDLDAVLNDPAFHLVVVAIAAFLVYVAMKPSDFRITRSQSIKAAPEAVFAYINDLHGFNSWNPFAQGDPALKIDYSGPRSGQGAAYASCGFVPTPMSLDFMGKPLAGKLDTDPRSWRFTLGDTDFF